LEVNLTGSSLTFYLEIGFLIYFYYFFSLLSFVSVFFVFSYLSTFCLIAYLVLLVFTTSSGFFESFFKLGFLTLSSDYFLSSFFAFSFTSSVFSAVTLGVPFSLFFFCFSYLPLVWPF